MMSRREVAASSQLPVPVVAAGSPAAQPSAPRRQLAPHRLVSSGGGGGGGSARRSSSFVLRDGLPAMAPPSPASAYYSARLN